MYLYTHEYVCIISFVGQNKIYFIKDVEFVEHNSLFIYPRTVVAVSDGDTKLHALFTLKYYRTIYLSYNAT